jgi:actin-related protein
MWLGSGLHAKLDRLQLAGSLDETQAGLASSCVVNIGHETISICCVEEGISAPRTRVRLLYGGNDVAETMLWLLHKKLAFPFATIFSFSSHFPLLA